MSRVRAKICGVRTPEDAIAAAHAGASMVGLVFVPGSPREIDRGQAEAILAALPAGVEPVALLADAVPDHPVLAWWRGRVQLHGEETEATCAAVCKKHRWWRPPHAPASRWRACRRCTADHRATKAC
jgi:phosphoribosylanthranilate isomerase